jgi:hypothetical protein
MYQGQGQVSSSVIPFPELTLCRYYSTYGHVAKLADEIQKGVSSVEGVDVKLWQVITQRSTHTELVS